MPIDLEWFPLGEVQVGSQLLQQFDFLPPSSYLGCVKSTLVHLYLLFLSLALWSVSGLTALDFIGLQT